MKQRKNSPCCISLLQCDDLRVPTQGKQFYGSEEQSPSISGSIPVDIYMNYLQHDIDILHNPPNISMRSGNVQPHVFHNEIEGHFRLQPTVAPVYFQENQGWVREELIPADIHTAGPNEDGYGLKDETNPYWSL